MKAWFRARPIRLRPVWIAAVMLLLKALLFRYFVFDHIAWGQVVADAASIAMFIGLLEALLADRAKAHGFWVLNLFLSALMFASAVYVSYFSTIPTYSALNELNQVAGVQDSIRSTLKWKYFLFFPDLAVMAVLWLVRRIRRKTRTPHMDGKKWRLGMLAVAAVGMIISDGYMQYGKSIYSELARADEIGFLNYQISAVFHDLDADGQPIDIDQVATQITKLVKTNPNVRTTTDQPALFGSMAGKNVVVIQLEAFQNFPIHLRINGQEITPVLNDLADNGYYFPRFFQQIGQGNTSDAEFLSNTSIYPTARIAMSTGYGDRELPSLPRLLRARGYVAETFHPNDVTFWDRDKLYPALGFDRYFDRPAFFNDQFNAFGASDVELYRTAVRRMVELKQENKPFYMQLVTVSSHHPFQIPSDKQWLDLPGEIAGTQLGDYLQAIHYTDYAVGELIRMLNENGLYEDTMLVLYGDHFGLQPEENDPADIGRKLGIVYHERISRYNVPLIISVPGESPRRVVQTVGGQVDIMPTLANLLGVSLRDENVPVFGMDLLNTERNVFGIRYYLPTGSFVNQEVMFIPGKSFEDGVAISLDTLEPLPEVPVSYRKDYEYVLQLMSLSDLYVKMLPKRE